MNVRVEVQGFCRSGEREEIKGAVHALAGMIAVAMAAYNITAWHYRRQRHLGINSIVYSLAVAWEVKQTLHHLRPCVEHETSTPIAA
jgi:hypothetical protein